MIEIATLNDQASQDPASRDIDAQTLVKAVARYAAGDIARRNVLRSGKAANELATQLEKEFTACFGYWDLYFSSGADRIPAAVRDPKSGNNAKAHVIANTNMIYVITL